MRLLLVLAGVALVFAQVYVFSDGSGYAVFSHMGLSVYSMDGQLQYVGGAPAYPGPTCIAFYTGAGVSVVTPRGALRAFYPLNFTPVLLATDCQTVAAVNQTAGVYISQGVRYVFQLKAPPYAMSMLNGVAYVLDMSGDVVTAGPNGVSVLKIGGYPAGAAAGPHCVVASVVRGDVQYFYRVDAGTPQLIAQRRAKVGLAYTFAVGPGCRFAYVDGEKETAVALDGPYTIYGTSTGYIEVYRGDKLLYSKHVGGPVLALSSTSLNIAYETPAGVRPLILVNLTVYTNCGVWSMLKEASEPYSPPHILDFGNGTRCVLNSSSAAPGAVYAVYTREYYVQLSSPQPYAGWLPAGTRVPPPPEVFLGYIRLVPEGWTVGGRVVKEITVAGPLYASAVYRAVPAVNGTLGNGTAVVVSVDTPQVVWPQQPVYAVKKLYYVYVAPPGSVSGGPGYYPAGSHVAVSAGTPQAPPGCRYVFAGWVGINATAPNATVLVTKPISATPRYTMECLVRLRTKYGTAPAPQWVPVGTTITPEVAPTAVWDPFPIRYTFAGWSINGVVTKSIAVTGPVEAEAVWTLDPTPAVSLAVGAVVAGVAVAYTIRQAKRMR